MIIAFQQYEEEFQIKIQEVENDGDEGVEKIWKYFKNSLQHIPPVADIEYYFSENKKMDHYFEAHNSEALVCEIPRDFNGGTQLFSKKTMQFIDSVDGQKEFWETICGLSVSSTYFCFAAD